MRASVSSQGPQRTQNNAIVKNNGVGNSQVPRRNTTSSNTVTTPTKPLEKRRNPRPLSFTSSPTSSRQLPNCAQTRVSSKSATNSPTGNGPSSGCTNFKTHKVATIENGGVSPNSFVVKSPLDKNSLPAFYSEPPLVTRSVSVEEQKSSLENLISVISNVLKTSEDALGSNQCPVIQSTLQPIDPLKTFRNINHVKELNDKLAQLESENFKLKLKLFYLEEERGKGGYSAESNQNIHLQVELQEAKSNLTKRNELLKETLLYLNNINNDFDKRTQSPGTGKSSETCLRDKTTSEDESLASQGNCTTFAEDSVANNTCQIHDRDWLKTALNQLLSEALTITPDLKDLIENTKKTFNVAFSKTITGDFENHLSLDMNIEAKNKRIEELELELKKYRELDSSIPTRDMPVSHEVEQELRSLHQAVIEKDRLYQDAIKANCAILKESEERCKSIITVAQERSEEAQRLNVQLQEAQKEFELAKESLEESQSSISKLRNEIIEMKKAMEMEMREKNRILSEAEVLDQMQNEQSQELAKLKNELSSLQELHQRTVDDAHDKEGNLMELREKLKETQNQLEILRNQSKAVQKEIPANSIIWDASSIHNNSVADVSHNLMEQSSIGEFLKSFQGTDTNQLLLNHIYELEKFLHRLLTSDNPAELLSQGSFTPSYVDSLRKAMVNGEGTLDASQSGISLMLMERTFQQLPASMFDNDEPPPQDRKDGAATESDGTSRDRDMSDISVNYSYAKHVNKDNSDVDEGPSNDSFFTKRAPNPDKGLRNKATCVGNCKDLEPLVFRIETTVESLSRELAKFQNENPHLILQLLDMLKEGNGNLLPSLLEGQILESFEVLGGKMDSLGITMNDVNVAARTLAEFFNLHDDNSPKSNAQKMTYAKQLATSPLNISTNNENISPVAEGFLSGQGYDAQGRVQPPSYHSTKHSLSNSEPVPVQENLATLRDCYNQLVESLCSSLDWMKSINDSELNEVIQKQGVEHLLNNSYSVNKNISGSTSTNYNEELRKLNEMLPDWVRLNRSLFQILVKSLRDKKQMLQARDEQVAMLNRTLETKFKDLKQVQDWNLRLQNELDREKLNLASTLEKLASVQDAFNAASEEIKSKMDANAKIWGENKMLKSSIESSVSDKSAMKELCNKLRDELNLKTNENEEFQAELTKAYEEIDKYKNEYGSNRERFEQQLKLDYDNRVRDFKEQICNLTQLQQQFANEKEQLLTELNAIRKENDKFKEQERSWKTLEKQLDEKTKKIESLITANETEVLKRSNLEASLHEALELKVTLENDCRLLGERLNEIQKKSREMASQLKSAKEQLKKNDAVMRRSLKDANAQEKGVASGSGEVDKPAVATLESNEEALKQALQHEKEKAERYKKNLAYAKVLLKQKGIGLKTASMSSGLNLDYKSNETLDQVDVIPKDSGKSSKIHTSTECSSQTCVGYIEKEPQIWSVKDESGESIDRQSLENIIQSLLEEMNCLKSELDKTTKANEQLSEKIKAYETHSDSAKDPLVERPVQVVEDFISAPVMHQMNTTPSHLEWGQVSSNTAGNHKSGSSLARVSVERDIQSSSESLLHSRVIEQLGGQVNNTRSFAGFTCISNEVPVRDIDNDTASCNLRNMASDFQSSNEEIQTIISGAVSGINLRPSPRSVYSSPDLGIESDPNRERGWSASPSSCDPNQLSKGNFAPHSVQSVMRSAVHFGQGMTTSSATTLTTNTKTMMSENATMTHESNLVVVGQLGDLVLLKKEVEESVAILEGIKARVKDRIATLTQRTINSSPAKSLELSTLKEVDSSCYKLQVCLCRSITILSGFSSEPKKPSDLVTPSDPSLSNAQISAENNLALDNQDAREQELELQKLRLLYDEQSLKLKEALAALDVYQKRKENVEKAISKQLSKTKRVLRKAKGNLLEEKKAVVNNGQDAAAVAAADDDLLSKSIPQRSIEQNKKQVASTPMVKFNK